MKKYLCCSLFILIYAFSMGQKVKMNKKVKELVALGKDSIIEKALSVARISSSKIEVNKEDFDDIIVSTDGKKVYVAFKNYVYYLPKNTRYLTDFFVGLDSFSTHGYRTNPRDFLGEAQPYKHTEETEKHIQFVLKAIKDSDGAPLDRKHIDGNMEIRDEGTYYAILVVSNTQESSYKIEKISGRIYDENHAHLALPPEPSGQKPIFVEITK